MGENNDLVFKVVLVGNSGVGKTCIFFRLTDNMYMENTTTSIGVDCKVRNIEQDGKIIHAQIWDTAGQERFRTITPWYYRNADGIIIVYDCTDQKSFESVETWLKEIDLNANENVAKLLVGNKCDLKKTAGNWVDTSTARDYANQLNIPFLETSSKDAINIEQAFLTMISEIKKRRSSLMRVEKEQDVIRITDSHNEVPRPNCCDSVSTWWQNLW